MEILKKCDTACARNHPQIYTEQFGTEFAELPPLLTFQGNYLHDNEMMPIEPCVTTVTLCDERCVLGSMLEDLTLALWGLDVEHPKLVFYRYDDTDVNMIYKVGGKM